jgi:glycosyltransferase involved in cell wall biosynthesis
MIIPVIIAAHNEERAIGPCLDSLLASARDLPFEFTVVLDDCTDGTRAIVERYAKVKVLTSHGGKVEAQRRAFRADAPFQIFSDADILADGAALETLAQAMLDDPKVLVAFPRLEPLRPRRGTPLAKALHVYNLNRGFSSQRAWFNGKLFALRGLGIPSREEVSRRAQALPKSAFYDYEQGLVADDILLSRLALLQGGPQALRETAGRVRYRAPETLRGMYLYYRRLRRELSRTDALFPETAGAHRTRSADLLGQASAKEKILYALFQSALLACRAAYRFERLKSLRIQPWPVIAETKEL